MMRKCVFNHLIKKGVFDKSAHIFLNIIMDIPQIKSVDELDVMNWFDAYYKSNEFCFYDDKDRLEERLKDMGKILQCEALEILSSGVSNDASISRLKDKKLFKDFDFKLNGSDITDNILRDYAVLYYSRHIRRRHIEADFSTPLILVSDFNKSSLVNCLPDCSFSLKGKVYSSIINIGRGQDSNALSSIQNLPFVDTDKNIDLCTGITDVDFGIKKDIIERVIDRAIDKGYKFNQVKAYVKKELSVFFENHEIPNDMMSFSVKSERVKPSALSINSLESIHDVIFKDVENNNSVENDIL